MDSDRRVCGRIRVCELQSDRGQIADLSRTGLRLISTRRLRGTITLRLFSREGIIDVTGQVIRCQRLGFRRFDVGVQLDGVSQDLSDALARIAVVHGLSNAA